MFAGGAVVATRQLRKSDNSWAIALALMAGGTLLSGIAGINNLVAPTPQLWGLLLIMSTIATAGQLLLIYSYKFVNVLEGGTISMATVPVAVVLAVAFLGETITLPFLTGASLVFGSTIYLLRSHPGEIIR
jgi:drug/metabolite transporter (DMT)-like permease